MLTNSGVLKMALYFDDDHLNSADRKKNADHKKYNGGVDGVAKKWEDTHAKKNTYNGIGGNAMSRKQGTGELGRQQTVASDAVDTSQMEPEEKYRYLQALGLIPGGAAQPKVDAPAQTARPMQNRPFRRGR